jgi:DNA segregation ATPase FtsK/SpoIIIE-like protein
MGAAASTVSTAVAFVAHCLGAFREAPQAANSTVSQIERHAAMEEARKQAEEARRHADEAKAREEEARRLTQAANQRELEARQREEQAHNEKALLEQQAEAATVREEEAKKMQQEALREKSLMEKQAEEARQNLALGIQPVVWPTAQELAHAKQNADYRDDLLHFAVCGPSGSGKSSLINALRGLKSNEEGAAKTGVVECTEKMQRYPDPRAEMPYPRFVWYDVPGAGTSKIPGWQYFIQQGLFIFDFVVLVYDMVIALPPPPTLETKKIKYLWRFFCVY